MLRIGDALYFMAEHKQKLRTYANLPIFILDLYKLYQEDETYL